MQQQMPATMPEMGAHGMSGTVGQNHPLQQRMQRHYALD
jgi:hypothetical protein